MAEVIVKGTENLKRISDNLYKALDEGAKQVMADIMLEVRRNTDKGLNADKVPFIAYASSTVQDKIDSGRSVIPNMQQSSSMMNSLGFIPASKSKTFIVYKIGVSGSHDGVANKAKLKWLNDYKNYYILRWTPYYTKLANKHMDKAVKRFIKSVS